MDTSKPTYLQTLFGLTVPEAMEATHVACEGVKAGGLESALKRSNPLAVRLYDYDFQEAARHLISQRPLITPAAADHSSGR